MTDFKEAKEAKEAYGVISNLIDEETQRIIKAVEPIETESVSFPEYKSNVFTLKSFDVENESPTYPDELTNNGIYVFVVIPKDKKTPTEVSENVNEFDEGVRVAKFNKTKGGVSYYDKKTKRFKDLELGEILYVGKAEDDTLQKRLKEHITDNDPNGPSSLRLNSTQRKFLYGNLKCMCFVLKDDYSNCKDCILPKIEKNLHKEKKPRAGSSRS